MSRANAAHSLPPGDRDDAPIPPAPPTPPPREPPGLTLELDMLGTTIANASARFALLADARERGDDAAMAQAAHALVAALKPDPRGLSRHVATALDAALSRKLRRNAA